MARPTYPSDDAERQMLRFPAGLKAKVAEAAKANKRSINAEIVARLEFSFRAETEPKKAIRDVAEALVLRQARDEYRELTAALARVEDTLKQLREERE